MSEFHRGPERRGADPATTPLATRDGEDRRRGGERRRNGYISKLQICRGLDYGEVESILEQCPTVTLKRGEILFEPGQANHNLFLLTNGQLEVRLKSAESKATDTIRTGECIGEMSIIDGQPTSAYVVATENCRLISVHENIFWSKLANNPRTVRNLSRVLAERMRRRNIESLRALEQEMRLQTLQKEMLAAREIQTGMLPYGPALLRHVECLDVHARMDVVKSVGGDFYDAFSLDDDTVCVAIGDVSGKGMPAALFMIRTATLLRAEINKSGPLAARMDEFNRVLCETKLTHMFVSLIVLCINIKSGEVEYVNAGHPPMLLSKARQIFSPIDESQGLIAGVLSDNCYDTGTLQLSSGDRLLLYTDGVSEARNPRREFYQLSGLCTLVDTLSSENSEHLVESLFEDVYVFAGETDQVDDITVIGLEFHA